MSWNLEEALSYYRAQGAPADQNALKNLLAEIQQEHGGRVPAWVLPRVAADYRVKESFLCAVIKRYPSLHLEEGGHVLELCCGSGCSKRGHLCEFVEQTYGKKPAEFSLRLMPCMHMCGQGPILRWDGEIHCGADEALIRSLVEGTSGPETVPAVPAEKEEKSHKSEKKEERKKDRKQKEEKEKKDKKKHKKD